MTPLPALLAASLSLIACNSALAYGVGASASLSNVQVGVTDLTPNDGQAAAYSILWVNNFQLSSASLTVADPFNNRDLQDFRVSSTLDVGSTRVDAGTTHSASTMSGLGNSSSTSQQFQEFGDGWQTNSGASQMLMISLAPHSAISVSGHSAWSASPYGSLTNARGFHSQASSAAELRLLSGEAIETFHGIFTTQEGNPGGNFQDDFLLTYGNTSNEARKVYLSFSSYSSTSYYVDGAPPPVPEPASYAMLGAGLLLLGAMRRKA